MFYYYEFINKNKNINNINNINNNKININKNYIKIVPPSNNQ